MRLITILKRLHTPHMKVSPRVVDHQSGHSVIFKLSMLGKWSISSFSKEADGRTRPRTIFDHQ